LWTSGNNISGQLGDGTTTYKNILTQINCTSLGLLNLNFDTFSVYPNLAKNYICLSEEIQIKRIVITNLLGKIVYTTTNDFSKINVESFQSGIYMLQIFTQSENYNGKFTKE
jgi:hypothetical protein